MKVFSLSIAFLMPLMAYCESYFKDGTRWVVEYFGTSTPEGVQWAETYSLQTTPDSDGKNALGLFVEKEPGAEPDLITFIKTEGEKVFFGNTTDNNWYLLYDFGLNIDDTCTVYNLPRKPGEAPEAVVVKCLDIDTWDNSLNWPTMTLGIFEESSSDFERPDKWLPGLGARTGVVENTMFGMDGLGSWISEVWSDNELVYRCSLSSANQINIEENQDLIRLHDGTLHINSASDTTCNIFSADGTLLETLNVAANGTTLPLPAKGVYIVAIGSRSYKVMVP